MQPIIVNGVGPNSTVSVCNPYEQETDIDNGPSPSPS